MTTITTEPVAVRELEPGDIVWTYGMRCEVVEPVKLSQSHPSVAGGCYYTSAVVTNRDDVSRDVVPMAFTQQADGSHRWSLQGNDLAAFAREVTAKVVV